MKVALVDRIDPLGFAPVDPVGRKRNEYRHVKVPAERGATVFTKTVWVPIDAAMKLPDNTRDLRDLPTLKAALMTKKERVPGIIGKLISYALAAKSPALTARMLMRCSRPPTRASLRSAIHAIVLLIWASNCPL